MSRILVVDDEKDDRERLMSQLRGRGYTVQGVGGPEAAIEAFISFHPDVAIIDYRCFDGSKSDESGIGVARDSDPLVPKIMVSGRAERDDVMRAITTVGDGRPLLVRFLAKEDINANPSMLLDAVRENVTRRKTWLRQARESIGPELYAYHRWTLRLTVILYAVHILIAASFAGLLMWLTWKLHGGFVENIPTIVGALVGEGVVLFFFRRVEPLLEAANRNQHELVERASFEHLLQACDRVESPDLRESLRASLIRRASAKWIAGRAAPGDAFDVELNAGTQQEGKK